MFIYTNKHVWNEKHSPKMTGTFFSKKNDTKQKFYIRFQTFLNYGMKFQLNLLLTILRSNFK